MEQFINSLGQGSIFWISVAMFSMLITSAVLFYLTAAGDPNKVTWAQNLISAAAMWLITGSVSYVGGWMASRRGDVDYLRRIFSHRGRFFPHAAFESTTG